MSIGTPTARPPHWAPSVVLGLVVEHDSVALELVVLDSVMLVETVVDYAVPNPVALVPVISHSGMA
eukprot:1463837-Pyramimonas_sp.AAC.1